jgi:nucleotide-binding universal stress UspA family protein
MDPVTNTETALGVKTDIRIERILCPVDFSEASLKAYHHAQSIASHYGATLYAQYAVELWQYPSCDFAISVNAYEEFRQALISKGEDALHQFVRTCGGLQPECIVQESPAADAILSFAKARAISLIVLGTHGRRGFDRLMLGSVTERVLRHASCPVLAVRQKAPDSGPRGATDAPVQIRRILCGVDFSANSQRALEYALSAAKAYDAEVSILHVLDNIPDSADPAKETDAAVEKLEELLPPGVPCSAKTHLEVRLGKASQEILKFASEEKSDLIVTGVRGRNSLDLAVFGSTTYRVMQLGPVPVLTVPI